MFERLNTPEEIFSFKLGSALTMERDTLAMLADLEDEARRPELKQLLAEHAEETRRQISMIEQCFALLDEEVDASPCAVIKAIAAEGKATIKKTDDSLVDAVILAGALETEHHEQAVYETLLLHARARGAASVVGVLETNLAIEQSAGAKVKALAERIAVSGVAVPTEGMSRGAKAGIVAGVAATVGAAAAAALKAGDHHETGTPEATTVTGSGATAATSTPTAGDTTTATVPATGSATSAEEFNDDALEERIEESEHRTRP
ncbi:ferritin-like domain-containing protein [Kineococcus rubinsiae]|uniref:ferritin-like domain-containing protein n=1 Tax=Kineococcus rubinsiae TaxID=2609562 RepID=UPI001431A1C1|nr:ferritin-like domain-containing protein [Kineococcus rubinsiae]NIZ91783.1 ferritin-like domain-containing protein [Kineococcus rubinsiae]